MEICTWKAQVNGTSTVNVCVPECAELDLRRYLQLVNHLIKQFSCFRTVGILKVVLYTNLDHDGLEVAANTYMRKIKRGVHTAFHPSIKSIRRAKSLRNAEYAYSTIRADSF